MANPTIDTVDLDPQDLAEVFDETNLNEDAQFVTADETLDVYDVTSALGDARDDIALDAVDADPDTLEDEVIDTDEDVDDRLDDDLEDESDNEDIGEQDLEDTDDAIGSSDEVDIVTVADIDQPGTTGEQDSDDDAADDQPDEGLDKGDRGDKGRRHGTDPNDQPDESHPHQEELLDEGVEETFPASDPVSVKRIT